MTTGLERKAHRLVELARAGDDPSAAQLMNLHGAIAARIAAEGSVAASAGVKAGGSSLLLKGIVAVGAIATGAIGYFALTNEPTPRPPVSAVTHVLPPEPAPAPAPSPVQEPAVSTPAPVTTAEEAPAPVRATKPQAVGLRLQEEAALLAEVQGALRSGQGNLALSKLDSYDRRFPGGMLRAEADAAKVFALCASGRVDKARASATRFVQRYPGSPAAARVQAACK